jgi:DNA-binding transcriptional ArsR family regulator
MTEATQELAAVRRELAELRTQVQALVAERQSGGRPGERAARNTPDAPPSTDRTMDAGRKVAEADVGKVVGDHLVRMVQGPPEQGPTAAVLIGLVLGDRSGQWRSITTRAPVGPTGDVGEAARVFAALGNETRLRLLQFLWGGERTAQELGEGTGLSAGALYHHVRELAAFRWVETPRRNAYTITPAGRQALVCAWEFSRFLTGQRRLRTPGAPHAEGDTKDLEPESPAGGSEADGAAPAEDNA